MSSEIIVTENTECVIDVNGLGKCYQIYDKPSDRLKQMLWRGRRQYYKEFWALKDVSFKIKKGETVGIIGRNGSGKSTLLQMICGTLNPTAGQIKVIGRVAALLELGAGFNPEFSGVDNVYMAASLYGLSKEEVDQRFDAIAAFADIGDHIHQSVKTYSSGMYVRLAFAVIAHVDADILVIDEALAVGDAFFTQKCMRFLRSFMKTGTILFVSHDTNSVRSLCNRAVWLERGRVLKEGSPKDVCELYLEASHEAEHGKNSATKLKAIKNQHMTKPLQDLRLEFINATNLRNDLEIFAFDPDAPSFGKGGARITSVAFLGVDGRPLAWIVGGERVTLRIDAVANGPMESPIIGFFVKDRLGQTLFGENTFQVTRDVSLACEDGQGLRAEFTFHMPLLPSGNYSVNAAIADGTQQQHVQHHWIHDALFFKSEASSVNTGLIGIPMLDVKLTTPTPTTT
jgi:lipopolysaccharide transport system ATP-binding protein